MYFSNTRNSTNLNVKSGKVGKWESDCLIQDSRDETLRDFS